jgi:hypothetical protein
MKKKILVVVSLVIVVALLTTGAFAYFTTGAKTATGHIQSGTLNLKIAGVVPSSDCPATIDADTANLWNLTNMAPGDVVTGKLCMKNVGTLPIPQVVFDWEGMDADLAPHIFVTKLWNSKTNIDEIVSYIAAYDGWGGGPKDGKMSIAELSAVDSGWSLPPYAGLLDEYWVGGANIFLPVGAVEAVEYTLLFDPDAGNELQTKSFDYTLTITGLQNRILP